MLEHVMFTHKPDELELRFRQTDTTNQVEELEELMRDFYTPRLDMLASDESHKMEKWNLDWKISSVENEDEKIKYTSCLSAVYSMRNGLTTDNIPLVYFNVEETDASSRKNSEIKTFRLNISSLKKSNDDQYNLEEIPDGFEHNQESSNYEAGEIKNYLDRIALEKYKLKEGKTTIGICRNSGDEFAHLVTKSGEEVFVPMNNDNYFSHKAEILTVGKQYLLTPVFLGERVKAYDVRAVPNGY